VLGRDGLGAGEGGGEQGVVGQEVDLAGQAPRGLEQRLLGGGLEEGNLCAGAVQAMGEVGAQLVTGEGRQVVQVVVEVESSRSVEAAASALRPDIELPGAVRWVCSIAGGAAAGSASAAAPRKRWGSRRRKRSRHEGLQK
jgi:hypothetical protein